MSRRYAATLAVVAIVILTAGLLLRSQLYSTPVETAPPSEASTLRQLSQEAQLRRSATFVAEQVTALAPSTEYVAATGASGIWWTRDTLLSSTRAQPIVAIARQAMPAVRAQREDTTRRAVSFAGDSTRRGWVVVVGRDASGEVISAQYLAGGRTTATCAGASVQRYVMGAPLDERFAGAGVFAVDGGVVGLAVWCGDDVIALPAPEVRRVLAEPRDTVLESALGFRVAAPGPRVRSFVGSDSASLVTFVRRGSAAHDAGLRAGDVLVSIGGGPATAERARSAIGLVAPTDSLVLERRGARRGETLVVRGSSASKDAPFGIELDTPASPPGVPVARVRAGSPAASAGLRAGDRLVSVGSTAVTSATAERLLASAVADDRPTLVVVDREDGEHAMLVGAPVPPAAATGSASGDR